MENTVKIRIGTLEASVTEQDAKDLQRIFGASVVQQELTSLPEKWYTDGTAEANEWGKGVTEFFANGWRFIGPHPLGATGWDNPNNSRGTYITPAQFNEWVYNPWKESLKPKAPTTIEEVLEAVRPEWYLGMKGKPTAALCFYADGTQLPTESHVKSIRALCQLYNVVKRLNECFKEDSQWLYGVYADRSIGKGEKRRKGTQGNPVLFTSRAAAQHAVEHFWHLFADFYMLEDKQ